MTDAMNAESPAITHMTVNVKAEEAVAATAAVAAAAAADLAEDQGPAHGHMTEIDAATVAAAVEADPGPEVQWPIENSSTAACEKFPLFVLL